MTGKGFARLWAAGYAIMVFAIMCFVAWGIPDFSAWGSGDRALFLFLSGVGVLPWWAIGLAIWERLE